MPLEASPGRTQMDDMTMEVVCVACRSVNRVPEGRLRDDPSCGRCGKDLLPGRVTEVADGALRAIVERSQVPVIVDFWAPWCGPCHAMAPQYEQAAGALKGAAICLKVDSDRSDEARRLGIRSIPTLVRFVAGREVDRISGALPASHIVAFADGRAA